MRVEPNQIAVTDGVLHVGVNIHGPQGSWLKFAHLEIPLEDISERDFKAMTIWRVEHDWTPTALDDPALF